MNENIKQSIDEWAELYKRVRSSLIPRGLSVMPQKNLGTALIGVRRSGKTYIAIQLSTVVEANKVFYYNFEDPLFYLDNSLQNLEQLLRTAEEYNTAGYSLLILDEIQNIDGWEKFLRKLIDQKKYQIIITGSSASLLSKELSTALTGRCLEYSIWPLAFSEYLQFKSNSNKNISTTRALFREYLTSGGFPEATLAQDPTVKTKILQQYLNDIILKDVVNRNTIRNKRALDQILIFYLTNISSLHSYSSVGKAFNISTDTVAQYTEFLKDAFLIFEVERYHQNLKVQTRDPKKIYAIDNGLREVGSRSHSEDEGKLLENLVFIELKRKGLQINYFKGQQEVDFVISEKHKATAAIQVSAYLKNKETLAREISALMEAMNSLSLKEGTILTIDHEEVLREGGKTIKIIPAYRWLEEG